MANPQLEDGYIQIANDILKELIKTRIPGEEMQCLQTILLKTYGFHKKQDRIALSQFVELTGIKKQNVVRALNGLLSKKIIVIKKDNEKANLYEFNKDFEQWQPLSKKITLSKKIKDVIKKDNPSLSKKRPTKDNTTKNTITKNNTTAQNKKSVIKKDNEIYFDFDLHKFVNIIDRDLDEWKETYPAIDINHEILKAGQWLLSNPKNKKKNYRRFLTNWFGRAQEKAPRIGEKVNDPYSMINEAKRKAGML